MAIKIKAVSAEAATRHPGYAGIEAHAFAEKETKTKVHRDWLWLLKLMVKWILSVVLLFSLPNPISFLIILFTVSYYVNKLNRRYGRLRASAGRMRRFQRYGPISMRSRSASGLASTGVYQSRLVGAAGVELIPDTENYISDSYSSSWCSDINPASGLPMVENSWIDVGGNVFGDNSMISIDTSFNCGGISCDPFDSTI
ncbi:TPA: hypothetical protein ACVU5D_004057 [Vibrio parahaemolyticus]